jgi:uncharacterized protein
MDFSEVVQKIALALNPQQIILFGSRARGDFRPDSDYDLLIVVDDKDESRCFELAGKAHSVVRGKDLALDVIVYPKSEFEFSLREQHDVVCYAMDDGKVLYARSNTTLA